MIEYKVEALLNIENLNYNNIPKKWKYDCGNIQVECARTRASICNPLDGSFDECGPAIMNENSIGEYIVLLKEFWEEYKVEKIKERNE